MRIQGLDCFRHSSVHGGRRKKKPRETDGLYYRRYEYDAARAVRANGGKSSRVFKTCGAGALP